MSDEERSPRVLAVAWGRREVEDQGSTWDGNLSSSARHPHGLYLLERLASDCGVKRIMRVHVVWFRIDCPSPRLLAAPPIHRAGEHVPL
jgi:hypothetical protein